MPSRQVHYNLEHGFIQNWLVAGPQSIPVELGQFRGKKVRHQIVQHFYETTSGITKTPVERGPLNMGTFQMGDYTGSWSYHACREDHLVDHSGTYAVPHYLRSWAYTQLVSKTALAALLVLTTHGPADVWLNGDHVQRQEHFYEQRPGSAAFKVLLKAGVNKILVRFEAAVIRECAHAMALQVCQLTDEQSEDRQRTGSCEPYLAQTGLHVGIPTLIQDTTRRNTFERAAAMTYIAQDVFESTDQIRLHWSEDLKQSSPAVVRLITPGGSIYAEATVDGTAGDQLFLQHPFQIPAGPYRILIMPRTWEYYDHNLRITREVSLWNLGMSRYSAAPYGSFTERRQEALVDASQRKGLFAEIAKMALNQWTTIETEPILQTAQGASPLELLGILGMLYRFGSDELFPQELLQPLEDCILGYQYGDQAGWEGEVTGREDNLILVYACEILAGQRSPKRKFLDSEKTGQWHRKNGEQLALAWLQQCGATGFSDWDSQMDFAEYLVALSHLIDLAESEAVWEMAAVIMDKLFVTLAINSYQGVFGSTHGRTHASFVKGGFLEPTSGIARLMWGTGIFNHHIAGPVSLACMERYKLPALISDIAVAKPEEMWSRECHAVNGERIVNKVTYKTPDNMLCSVQDYYPGEKGRLEHIWQATLGPAATVFVTYPACTSEEAARQPNFWAGNATLPRVAQWKDILIAVYHLPEEDWWGGSQTGFTHAYFPTYAFDEYCLRQGWAFARKGEGYLALTASQGFNLVRHGLYALRELRSYGQENIWLCHMGRTALDGDFSTFQEKVLALPVAFEGQSVRSATLRGEVLSFGWQGPFLRETQPEGQQELPLSGFAHYENLFVTAAYPGMQMEIQFGESLMRLDFGSADSAGVG